MAVRIGRVAGVTIRVDVSVLLVFGLVTWALAAGTLPATVDDASAPARWAAALCGALLFFAALLAHETAHAVVARREGLTVRSLTLWLLGGVAELEGAPRSPGAEARMAIVGPLASVAFAFGAAGAAATFDGFGAPDVVTAVAWWLAIANAVLAVFNLLPAFPMDGGRVLRAALWRRWGDRARATAVAAAVGRAFGIGFVAFGTLELLAGGAGGLWLMLVGWFLTVAGRAEAASLALEVRLSGVRVADVMTRNPVAVPDWGSVADFVGFFAAQQRCPWFPVVTLDGEPVGVLTVAAAAAVPPAQRRSTRIGRVMVPLAQVARTTPDELVDDVLRRIAAAPAHVAAVLVDGRIVGLVGAPDLAYAQQLAELGAPLRQPVGASR